MDFFRPRHAPPVSAGTYKRATSGLQGLVVCGSIPSITAKASFDYVSLRRVSSVRVVGPFIVHPNIGRARIERVAALGSSILAGNGFSSVGRVGIAIAKG